MAKNEKTSPRVARIASKVLKAKNKTEFTLKEAQEIASVAASALTQAPDKPKKRPDTPKRR
jgi:hypothetical protein